MNWKIYTVHTKHKNIFLILCVDPIVVLKSKMTEVPYQVTIFDTVKSMPVF